MVTFDELVVQQLGPKYAKRLYDKAYKKALEQLNEKAREEALERQRAFLLRQLPKRFGAVPEAIAERVARAGADELDRWCEHLIDAASLDELFAA